MLDLFVLNPPTWSLFYELLINVAFVLTLRKLRSFSLIVLCAACFPALIFWSFPPRLDDGYAWTAMGIAVTRTVFGFTVGMLIARLIGETRPRVSWTGFLFLVAIVAVALFTPTSGYARSIHTLLCLLFVFPAVVFMSTRIDPPDAAVGLATWLGVVSYAIYVLHIPLLRLAIAVAGHISKHGMEEGAPYTGIVALCVLLAVSWTADRYFDAPVRRKLTRVIDARRRFEGKVAVKARHPSLDM